MGESFNQEIELVSVIGYKQVGTLIDSRMRHSTYDPGITENQLYHLCASGLFSSIRICNNGEQVTRLESHKMAEFCAAVDARRETRVKVDVSYGPDFIASVKKLVDDAVKAVKK